jgi:hypothetical protein
MLKQNSVSRRLASVRVTSPSFYKFFSLNLQHRNFIAPAFLRYIYGIDTP